MRKVLVTVISKLWNTSEAILADATELHHLTGQELAELDKAYSDSKEIEDAFDPTCGGKKVIEPDDDFGDEELPVPQVCNLAECESCT